jgi:hypothetical protein
MSPLRAIFFFSKKANMDVKYPEYHADFRYKGIFRRKSTGKKLL